MARQKKVYNSVDPKTNRHQTRGGGMTTPKRTTKKRYQTQPLETPVSPTFLAARAAKKLLIKQTKVVAPVTPVAAQPTSTSK